MKDIHMYIKIFPIKICSYHVFPIKFETVVALNIQPGCFTNFGMMQLYSEKQISNSVFKPKIRNRATHIKKSTNIFKTRLKSEMQFP